MINETEDVPHVYLHELWELAADEDTSVLALRLQSNVDALG
jgi:hypothetical protein